MSFIREYRVHHSSADGVLLQLPGSNGFGRLTKDSLGNDFLASELLKQFSSRDHAPAILTRRRDAQGYLLLSLHIKDAWSGIHGYPRQVRELLTTLVRKNILAGLGTTTVGRVVKSSEKGTVLSIAPNRMAVAACESIPHSSADGSSAQIEVRVLHVDLEAHVLNVTTQEDVIERTPMDTLVCAAALETIAPQSTVEAKVLLSTTDDGCAVVEIAVTVPSTGVQCSVLGYYIYNWTSAKTKEVVKPPVVGSTLKLVVEFCPNFSELRESAPFVILSDRKTFSGLPAVRSMPDADGLKRSRGLLGLLPWRSSASGEASDSEEDDEGGEASPDTSTRLRKRKLEEAIDSYERNMADAVPTTPEEFQRLLLGTPKSSFLWTQYMAYHVGLQQYEDARQVAEKALQTIGDSDSREQLNVWVTYLNIENLYGTTESLTSVFKRALARQLNGLALHQKLADIFEASRKTEQLLALCRSMTSKFRTSRAVWERLGVVLVNLDKRDQLKRVIKELGDALKREEAAMAVAHIAIHEYKNGSVENGRALFEGLLAKTPKKSDIWSQYIDQEQSLLNRKAEQASVTHVRSAMERAETMNFNAKVMQQFLTRHLAFEKVYGSPADLEKVKERARQYVESKIKSVTA